MNKKIVYLVLAVLMVLAWVSCCSAESGAEEIEFYTETHNVEKETEPATPTDLVTQTKEKMPNRQKLQEEDFVIVYGEIEVRLGEDPDKVIQEIEDVEQVKIEGCEVSKTVYAPAGMEYDAGKIGIRTDPENGGMISAVFVDDGEYETNRGIRVGDSIEKVREKYGNNYEVIFDQMIYTNKYDESCPTLVFQIDEEEGTVYSFAVVINKIRGNPPEE